MSNRIVIRIGVVLCLGAWVILLFNLGYLGSVLPVGIKDVIVQTPFCMIFAVQILFSVSWYLFMYKSEHLSVSLFFATAFMFVIFAFLFLLTFFTRYQFIMFATVIAWLLFQLYEKNRERRKTNR